MIFLFSLFSILFQQSQVPVLCYHNLHISDSGPNDALHISRKQFDLQIQWLYQNGYKSISPDELYDHLNKGTPLPAKPVMITFDDTREEHYSIAAPVLKKYGYKGVFFIMTVSIGKPRYMTAAQIKALSDSGHVIASHTWDHPNVVMVVRYDPKKQLELPKQLLEKITGKGVRYFAYPYGAWNEQAISDLKAAGFKAAFQLDGRQSIHDSLYSIRRIMVSGSWSGVQLEKKMRGAFP